MDKILFFPPVVFLIVLFSVFGLAYLFSKIAFCSKNKSHGKGQSYACGEDNYDNMAQPDYSQFFPFVFFFTIAHVATLILTSVPVETTKILTLALLYIGAVIVGLCILLRR
ncbi:hypothetical protein EPO66_02775 [bacterium]|nr:MAG: hypothetical protein EPO66_02775 [bacterium]